MRFGETGGAFLLGLMLSACAIVSPLVDRSMGDAPNAACAAVNGDHPLVMRPRPGASPAAVEAGAPEQCFALAEELADGTRRAWSGGALQPGRTLIAVHRPGGDCGGTFSHLSVTGASAGAGSAELATWDQHGRTGHQRVVRWNRGFESRSFALASVGSAIMSPAGARIRVIDGSFDPASLCFKSY
jgi:hypothetical protein